MHALAVSVLLVDAACALGVAVHALRTRDRRMPVMNAVWPLSALYLGPFGVWAYARYGQGQDEKPFPATVLVGALHCGAGCMVGDTLGDWLVFWTGFAVFGALGTRLAVAFALAYAFGIAFQYFAIAPMRGLGLKEGLVAAAKADTLSLAAYEVGMFGWMILSALVLLPGAEPTDPVYWLSMQAAMILGLATTYPMNWILIRRGIKEAM